MLTDLEQKYSSTDIPSCDKLTTSVIQEHTAERERVLHLIDQVAVAGEEIVIRVRQQDSDQVTKITVTVIALSYHRNNSLCHTVCHAVCHIVRHVVYQSHCLSAGLATETPSWRLVLCGYGNDLWL